MKYYLNVLKKYADFSGRARRMEYWMFTLFHTLAIFILTIPILASVDTDYESPLAGLFIVLAVVYIIGTFIPSLAVTVRRLHDTGRSGAWFFITFVPYIGGLWLFILTVLDSQAGRNQYGPNPKFEQIL